MLPAWCHLCWHLELTAWKACTGALLSCLKPLLLLRASSLTPAWPTSRRHRCLWYTCQHLPALCTEQSPLQSSYPNPPTSSRFPPLRTNRLLCKTPGLQLPSEFSERSGISLSQHTHYWEAVSDGKVPDLLELDTCGAGCEDLQRSLPAHALVSVWKLQETLTVIKTQFQTRQQWSHRSYFIWHFQAGKTPCRDMYTSKELVLRVGCWCIYSCTFIRKLLFYQ